MLEPRLSVSPKPSRAWAPTRPTPTMPWLAKLVPLTLTVCAAALPPSSGRARVGKASSSARQHVDGDLVTGTTPPWGMG